MAVGLGTYLVAVLRLIPRRIHSNFFFTSTPNRTSLVGLAGVVDTLLLVAP